MRLLYMTAPDEKEALVLGRTLVEERLIACANVLKGMQSVYRWEGRICQEEEAVLIAKTSDDLVEKVIARVRELHSYDVPCVLSLPIEKGNPDYLEWLTGCTGSIGR